MSKMTAIKNAVCVTGKYMKDGVEKKQYTRVGKLFKYEDGGVVLKMESVPVNFDGWINFYDLDENRQANNEAGMAQAKQAAELPPIADDDIPFN